MIVLDTSFVVAFLTPDRRQAFVLSVLRASSFDFRAPTLLLYELVHVLTRKQRQGDLSMAARDRALAEFDTQPVVLDRIDSASLSRIASLAATEGLSGYDATFLELAIRLGGELATLDAELAAAGRRCGVVVHHAP